MLEKEQLLEDRERARHYLKRVLTAAKDANRVADRLRECCQQAEQSEAPNSAQVNQASLDSVFPGITLASGKKVGRVLKCLIVDDGRSACGLVTLFLAADQH